MHCVRPVAENLFWVGASERHHPLFESAHPVPQGMSYDSYLLLDEKTVLLDTVDQSVQGQFFENVEHLLNGRPLDYVVVHHMEPDHAAALGELLARHPEATVVCSGMAVNMIRQFHRVTPTKLLPVKEGDTLCAGRHTFTFVAAPMVHWPEVLVSYESTEKILFSADAFGTFGALDGVLFADEVDFDRDCIDEARRYYTNIVGKYGPQVTALLKKAAGLDIRMICPLHGPVWRKDLGYILDKYQKWAAYEPEVQGVIDRLRLGLRRNGDGGYHPGCPPAGEGRACGPVRCVGHSPLLCTVRGLQVQPPGLCLHHLQQRDLCHHGDPAPRHRGPLSEKPYGGPDSRTAPGRRPAASSCGACWRSWRASAFWTAWSP